MVNQLIAVSAVVVHKTALKDYLLFVCRKSLDIELDRLCASVSADNSGIELLLARNYRLANAAHEYVIAALVIKLRISVERKGKNTPVYAVGAMLFKQFKVLPRTGMTAWNSAERPNLQDERAESPSTM